MKAAKSTSAARSVSRHGLSVALMVVSAIVIFATASQAAQTEREGNFTYSEDANVGCQDIIDSHEFEGSCCSLFSTSAGGCTVNVTNGNCIISGSIWDLDFNSEYTIDDCPESEFDVPTKAPVTPPTMAPTASKAATTAVANTMLGLSVASMLTVVAASLWM